MLGGVALWAGALPWVELRRMTDLGLVSVLPPLAYLGLAILAASFCLAVRRRETPEPVLLAHVAALVLLIHATPPLVYGTLRYSWAWKHVGIVDYIQRHGSVDPGIAYLNAYHNWPGFFALSALALGAAGVPSAIGVATWAPPVFNLLFGGGVLLVVRALTTDRRLVWLSVWLFVATNWVGQDY
ncbi:MAG TPA: glycosyltransferase, partial [Chloroflexota bacterium]